MEGGVGGDAPQASGGAEKHPKEEARARTAAALEKLRKQSWKKQFSAGGFFA
jgi:hypothetical protein